MSEITKTPSTIGDLDVAMFTVADVDAAIAWYTDVLGFEVRADVTFGPEGENRWVEVAPPGSAARLALNPVMGTTQAGQGGIGVRSADVLAEFRRLSALGVVDGPEPQQVPGAPLLFMVEDPDGNAIAVVQPDA